MARMRYESLVRAPRLTMARTLEALGTSVTADDLGFIHEAAVELPTDHFAAGSRMRMNAGEIPLVADEIWREELSVTQRRLVTAVASPLLLRYGYVSRRDR
jgi:hypothetical protein